MAKIMDHEQARKVKPRGSRGRTGARAISRSDQPPYISSDIMCDEQFHAHRVIIDENTRLPEPSEQLYNALAMRGWTDYRRQMMPLVDHEMPEWDDLPLHLQVVWLGIAHGQLGIIALLGGGTLELIDAD